MKSRISRVGLMAKYAITGRPSQLTKFESVLKKAGYSGVISNEGARVLQSMKAQGIKLPRLKWIVLYHNSETSEKIYAYRTEPGLTAMTPPSQMTITQMTKILNK